MPRGDERLSIFPRMNEAVHLRTQPALPRSEQTCHLLMTGPALPVPLMHDDIQP